MTLMHRFALLPLLSVALASSAFAHHGWSEYDAGNPLTLRGTIQESGYSHPHGTIRLQTEDKTWTVVLAPPTRMENRGLEKDMLSKGREVEVAAYPNRNDPQEARAEHITIDGKTIQLR